MNTERPLGVALVALGVTGIAVASQISVRTFNADPGPKLFPIFACAILVFCGLGMILSRPAEPGPRLDRAGLLRGVLMAGLLGYYALALWLVGFHIASFTAVLAMWAVIAGPARRIWWQGLVYATAVTGGVHLLFATTLNAFLPRGILF